jgi:hypothetical protein
MKSSRIGYAQVILVPNSAVNLFEHKVLVTNLKKKMAFNQFLYQAHQLSVLVGYTL